MLNKDFIIRLASIFGLILLQSFLFGNISFLGWLSPMVYVLLVIVWPFNTNRYFFLLGAFVLGLGVDFFERTGGVHTFCLVTISFIRPLYWQYLAKARNKEVEKFRLKNLSLSELLFMSFMLILVHHSLFFLLQNLSFQNPIEQFKNIGISSLFTFVFVALYLSFSHRKEA